MERDQKRGAKIEIYNVLPGHTTPILRLPSHHVIKRTKNLLYLLFVQLESDHGRRRFMRERDQSLSFLD